MTKKRKLLDFEDAVQQTMEVCGLTREQAMTKLRQAMASGKLKFELEDPHTGDLIEGEPEDIKYLGDDGIVGPNVRN
jgi:hypothetical protein